MLAQQQSKASGHLRIIELWLSLGIVGEQQRVPRIYIAADILQLLLFYLTFRDTVADVVFPPPTIKSRMGDKPPRPRGNAALNFATIRKEEEVSKARRRRRPTLQLSKLPCELRAIALMTHYAGAGTRRGGFFFRQLLCKQRKSRK